jgi:hypothetical protein
MAAYLPLSDALIIGGRLEEQLVEWAHARFVDLVESRLIELPIEVLGDVTGPEDLDAVDGER